MTDKEALKIVNECIEEGKIVQEAFQFSFLYTVKEALEKQIPKKIEYVSDGDADGYPVWEDRCQVCEAELDGCNYYNHCPYCGQAIDWSEVENEI